MDFDKMTHAALLRFANAVDKVLTAPELTHMQRAKLISQWAYRCQQHGMPEMLDAAILRCQSDPVHPTASSIIDAVTGDVVAYNPGD